MERCQTSSAWMRFCMLSVLSCGFLVENTGLSGERRWERQTRRYSFETPLYCPTTGLDGAVRCGTAPGLSPLAATATTGTAPVVATPKSLPLPPVQKHPETVQLGYSVKGIPILMQVFGDEGPVTLIFGAIHGSEPNSGDLARRLLDYLQQHPEAYTGYRVAIIPVANPDGLVRNQRLNENKVDLNRNFPAVNWATSKPGSYHGGEKAASEPETQAVIKSVEMLSPQRIVSIHAITRGRECNNYDGPADKLAELMKSKNGYRIAKTIGYPTPGSFGSWAGLDRQIPTITLELPHDLAGADCWRVHQAALEAVIRAPLK
ncbi:MAG: Zinc carboxypeptidase [Planctomycetaceae bacterium]|nr:Zinc carboxypeptidase [Planctomycetaceae bacterium]